MYGGLARNLAASIRSKSPDIAIAVAYTDSAIVNVRSALVKLKVELIPLPEECYTHKGKTNFFKAKTHIYDLSPFHKTLFLDSDTLWLNKNVDEFFKELEASDFSICNEGKINVRTGEDLTTRFYTFWTEYDNILSAYGERLGDFFYQCRSEVIYFKKNRQVSKLFRIAKSVYENPKCHMDKIAGNFPDEFAFNIASSICGIYPHKDKWIPAYWKYRDLKVSRTHRGVFEIATHFPILSVGGNYVPDDIKNMYNRRVDSFNKSLQINGAFQLKDKRDVLPERHRI